MLLCIALTFLMMNDDEYQIFHKTDDCQSKHCLGGQSRSL